MLMQFIRHGNLVLFRRGGHWRLGTVVPLATSNSFHACVCVCVCVRKLFTRCRKQLTYGKRIMIYV